MNTNKTEPHINIVNNGIVYLPTQEEWQEIFTKNEFFDKKVRSRTGLDKWIEYRLELSKKYPELQLGLFQYGLEKFGLSPIVILKIDNDLQRVHIEELTCEYCDWHGETANPMLSDLYKIGTWLVETRKAERFPVLPCPKCNNKLPRHPIWIEPNDNRIVT